MTEYEKIAVEVIRSTYRDGFLKKLGDGIDSLDASLRDAIAAALERQAVESWNAAIASVSEVCEIHDRQWPRCRHLSDEIRALKKEPK